jgi:hypothetical protein
MSSLAPRSISAALLGLLAFVAGCGGTLKTYPVTGKVTLKGGKPLAGARVEFETKLASGKRVTAHGETQADGSYTLETPELGSGAVAGEHKIIVSPPAYPPGNADGPPPQSVLDKRFQSYGSTPLRFTVQPGGPFDNPIEVEGPRR